MLLDALAAKFAELFGGPGLDWSLYDEQGLLVSDPRYSYRDVVLERIVRVYDVVGSFTESRRVRYQELRADEGRSALTQLYTSLQGAAGDALEAAAGGDVEATLTMTAAAYEDAVLSLLAYVADGAGLHLSLVMDDALVAEAITLDDLRAHADNIVRMTDAIVRMDQDGGFDDLKVEMPAAGLGFAWLAALPAGAWWAITAVGVAVVLGFAYLLHGVFVTLPVQEKTLDTCMKLAEKGLIASSERCFEQMPNPDQAAPWAAPLRTLSYVVIGGIALYAVSLALPHLLRARREARAT
jgi:hypothetical protein